MTFPVAFWFFAYSFTFRLGSLTVSYTMRSFANCYTFWAIEHFASFIWAFNFTLRFLAFNIANCVFGFGTASVAFWRFAYWVADSGAVWVITFP